MQLEGRDVHLSETGFQDVALVALIPQTAAVSPSLVALIARTSVGSPTLPLNPGLQRSPQVSEKARHMEDC